MAISESNSRTAQTNVFYANTFRQLEAQTRVTLRLPKSADVAPIQIVDFLIKKRRGIAKRTWQTYKSAVVAQLEALSTTRDDPVYEQECHHAVSVLAKETQTEAMSRGTRTSALKARRITNEDHARLMAYLSGRIGKDKLAKILQAWCDASLLTGLRPSEWAGTSIEEDEAGRTLLVVVNAKATHGRGNGYQRHLDLSELAFDQLEVIRDMVSVVEAQASIPEETFGDLQKQVADYMSRAARKAFGRRKRYPSLYSYRHQFSADAKATLPAPEVGALMGHGSDATAGRNYARASASQSPTRVRPIAAEVALVRRVAQPAPQKPRAA